MNLFGISFDAGAIWLLGTAGAAIAWVVLHRLAMHRDTKNRYATACASFRCSVHQILVGLYPIPIDWPNNSDTAIIDVLNRKFPVMQVAVEEFRAFVPKEDLAAFDQAWRMYHLGKDGRTIDQQDYWQYVPYKGSGRTADGTVLEHDNTHSYQDDFKKNIDYLLSFAKDA